MSLSAVLELLGRYLEQHNVQYTPESASSSSALWRTHTGTISVTAVAEDQVLISVISGSSVSSAVYTNGGEEYETFEQFVDSKLPLSGQDSKDEGSDGRESKQKQEESKQEESKKEESKQEESQQRNSKERNSKERNLKESSAAEQARQSNQPGNSPWRGLPAGHRARPSDMPDFDDEYELKSKRFPTSGPSLSIGDGDLYPAGTGPHPHLKPYIDPLAVPGSGMVPDSSHPIFGQNRSNTSRLGVPPGARFDDPYGEDNLDDMGMGLPGNLRTSGPSFGGGPGGFGGSGFGGSGFGGSGFGGSHFG